MKKARGILRARVIPDKEIKKGLGGEITYEDAVEILEIAYLEGLKDFDMEARELLNKKLTEHLTLDESTNFNRI